MFGTQSYKVNLCLESGYTLKYLKLGSFCVVFGNKTDFKDIYTSVVSRLIDDHTSSVTANDCDSTDISTDLAFQHNFRKNNTLRAYLTPESANFSINFGLTKHRTQVVRRLIESIDGKDLTFLELGSGSSVGTATAAKSQKISNAIALDYDAYSLENIVPIVFKNLNVDHKKVSTKVGTFSDTGQSSCSIDVMYAGGALHHCIDFKEAFEEAFRILKPGGIFFISDFVPHDYLSQRGRDFIFESPHGTEEALKKSKGQAYLSNKEVTEHYRSDIELLYHAQMAGFQTKWFKFIRQSNSLLEFLHNLGSLLNKRKFLSRITDFSFNSCGLDSAGNHIESRYNPMQSPAIFNLLAIIPLFLYRRMNVLAPRFDNRLYVLRKPNANEHVAFRNMKGEKINHIPV